MSILTQARGSWQHNRAARRALQGYLFASPWIIGFLVFTLGPMVASLIMSFTDYSVMMPTKWLGLANYVEMFTNDRLFGLALYNTVYYSLLTVGSAQVVSLGLALLLNQNLVGMRFYRTAFYAPSLVSGVALAMLWLWILDPNIGFVNNILRAVGLRGVPWLTSPTWSKPAMALMSIWGFGNTMVIYLAALQDVPVELTEAASIDGAGKVRQFWHITIPMISPTILFNLVMSIIGSFQVFSQAYIMTQGGPLNSTLFYVLYLFRKGFQALFMGYASAMAWFLFLILLVLTALVFRSSPLWVHYATEGEGA
jgi:multiple sugar transport system permease protein